MNIAHKCLLVAIAILFGISIGVNAENQIKKKPKFTWKKYHHVCGKDNADRDANFEKIKGKTIVWKGKVAEITEDVALGNHRTWAGDVIRVKMDPSDSIVADVRLRIPKQMVNDMNRFSKGDFIGFKGKIMYLGSRLGDHIVEVEKFKRLVPKKKG